MAGTEVYTHTLAKIQKSKGHEVSVIIPHIEHYVPGGINYHYQYDLIDVYEFMETANPKDRNIFSGKKKPEGLNNFLTLLKELQPDVVHFHELNRSIGLTIEHIKIARQYGAKIFITMHLSFYTCNTNRLIKNNQLCNGNISEVDCSACSYNSLFNIPSALSLPLSMLSIFLSHIGFASLLRPGKLTTLVSIPTMISRIKHELAELAENTHQIIALTEWYKKILLNNEVPVEKVSVIQQALAASALSYKIDKNFKTINLPIRIVFVGRVQIQKGVHLLIEVLKHFNKNELIVDIYGKEEMTDYYKKCVADSSALPNVFWKGVINQNEVVDRMSGYDLLCLPSTFSEMSPLVIQEAFAAGIPVLASKVYGNIEQIKHGLNGLLFDYNSSESLQEQLKFLVDMPSMINVMKKNIVPPASFELVCNHYLNLYQKC